MVLDKSAQNQDSFTSKIDASLGCDDDREGWHTYHQYGEEGHGAHNTVEKETLQCDKIKSQRN